MFDARKPSDRNTRRASLTCTILLIGVLSGCGLPARSPVPQSVDPPATRVSAEQQCVVQDVAEQVLTVGEARELYVEPAALVASGGDVLLAGSPNYLWTRDSGGKLLAESQDSVFGVVVREDGSAVLVGSPVSPQLIEVIRAVPFGPGSWAVVFAEMTSGHTFARPGKVARLWYGVLKGNEWDHLEEIPYARSEDLHPRGISDLLLRRDTVAVAIPTNLIGTGSGVVYFERANGAWTHEFVRAPDAVHATLSYAPDRGVALGIVQPAPELEGDANSFFLYSRGTRWDGREMIVRGGSSPVFAPSLTLTAGGGGVLTYFSVVQAPEGGRSEGRVLLDPLGSDPQGRIMTVDSSSVGLTPVILPPGGVLWVSDHAASDERREIHFIGHVRGAALYRHVIPNPYEGPFAAARKSDDEVLVAGPRVDRGEGAVPLVTLLLRARVSCRGTVP